MPYKDKQKQREYKKLWLRKRRQDYLGAAVCAHCWGAEDLQLHHLDPAEKEDHRIWGWSRERLESELGKCIVLCMNCHYDVHHGKEELKTALDPVLAKSLANLPF